MVHGLIEAALEQHSYTRELPLPSFTRSKYFLPNRLPTAPVLGVDFDLPSCRACHCAGAAWPAVRRFVLAALALRGERALTVPTLRLTLPKNIRPRDANVAKIRSSSVNSAEIRALWCDIKGPGCSNNRPTNLHVSSTLHRPKLLFTKTGILQLEFSLL